MNYTVECRGRNKKALHTFIGQPQCLKGQSCSDSGHTARCLSTYEMDSLMLQKLISHSPTFWCNCSKQGAKEGLGRRAGTGEGKGNAKAWWRECCGENGGEFLGNGRGRQRHGYHGCQGSLGPWPRRFCQTHPFMIANSLSYMKSTERIIYSYLSSGHKPQTIVGTRHWVLGTQVFFMILKQKKCDETKPPLFSRVPFYALRVFIHMSLWESMYVAYRQEGMAYFQKALHIDGCFLGIKEFNSIKFPSYSKRKSEGTGLREGRLWESSVWLSAQVKGTPALVLCRQPTGSVRPQHPKDRRYRHLLVTRLQCPSLHTHPQQVPKQYFCR